MGNENKPKVFEHVWSLLWHDVANCKTVKMANHKKRHAESIKKAKASALPLAKPKKKHAESIKKAKASALPPAKPDKQQSESLNAAKASAAPYIKEIEKNKQENKRRY